MKTFLICIAALAFLYPAQAAAAAYEERGNRPEQTTDDCEFCKQFMELLRYQRLVENRPLETIQRKFYELGLSSIFKEYMPHIGMYVKLLQLGTEPEKLCQMMAKCRHSEEHQQPNNSTVCEFCTLAVNLIKDEIAIANASVQILVAVVKELCHVFQIVEKECDVIVDSINEIIQWIENKVDPSEICKRLGLCPGNTHPGRQLLSGTGNVVHSCHAFVDNLRKNGRKMERKINLMCNRLGLKKFHEYMPHIGMYVKLMQLGMEPEKLCQMMAKCRHSEEHQQPNNSTVCKFCTIAVNLIENEIVVAHASVQALVVVVKKLCHDFQIVEKECDVIVDNINEIIKWIENDVDPSEMCKRLGLCPGNTHPGKQLLSGTGNVVHSCRAFVDNLRTQWREGWHERKMERKINLMCNRLGLKKFHCSRLSHGFQIVTAMIRQGRQTDEICGAINPWKSKNVGRDDGGYKQSIVCDVCMMIMEHIGLEFQNWQHDLELIKKALDGMCDELGELSKTCQSVVDSIIEDLVNNLEYIQGDLDPSTVCQASHLCSTSRHG